MFKVKMILPTDIIQWFDKFYSFLQEDNDETTIASESENDLETGTDTTPPPPKTTTTTTFTCASLTDFPTTAKANFERCTAELRYESAKLEKQWQMEMLEKVSLERKAAEIELEIAKMKKRLFTLG